MAELARGTAGLAMAAAIAAWTALGGTGAVAAVVSVTYEGTVVDGMVDNAPAPAMDVTGVFGRPATSLTGATFSATVVFDSRRGERTTGPGGRDVIVDDAEDTMTSPILSAALTIGGATTRLTGDYRAELVADERADTYETFVLDYGQDLVEGDERIGLLELGAHGTRGAGVPGGLEDPFALSPDAAGPPGFFAIGALDHWETTAEARGFLAIESLVVSVEAVPPPAPVPLPASGVALAGALAAASLAWGAARRRG